MACWFSWKIFRCFLSNALSLLTNTPSKNSNVAAGNLFGIPLSGTHSHAFVSSYVLSESFCGVFSETNRSELLAFTSYALAFPNDYQALVDTYDAYDASELWVNSEIAEDADRNAVCAVASITRTVKVDNAADPDVLKLLDDSDISRFGPDVGDIEENFVVKENLQEGEEEQVGTIDEEGEDDKVGVNQEDGLIISELVQHLEQTDATAELVQHPVNLRITRMKQMHPGSHEKSLDLDLLKLNIHLFLWQYYPNITVDEVPFIDGETLYANACEFVERRKEEIKIYVQKCLDTYDYTADLGVPGEDVLGKIKECAQKCLNESQEEEVLVEESINESEAWNRETIVSPYSNHDNQPGIIPELENPKKKLPKNFPRDSVAKHNLSALPGKEKLPVDYLPNKMMRSRREESREEKKERKAAVKEARRDARKAKKKLRDLYRSEAQRAQKTAAASGPSFIR